MQAIDAHIHWDRYEEEKRNRLIKTLSSSQIQGVVTVSMDLSSSKHNLELAQSYSEQVYPAFGFHPEQQIPLSAEIDALFHWMEEHKHNMVAVGEVGLPYYLRKSEEAEGRAIDLEPYIHLLDRFIAAAKAWDLPIILHAVYEDADIACDLLDKHDYTRAHFHWFKGSAETIQRMIQRGYYISITPDVVYEQEIQALVKDYPLDRMMVETDGPWPFEGPYEGLSTEPSMVWDVITKISELKGETVATTSASVLHNTCSLYRL